MKIGENFKSDNLSVDIEIVREEKKKEGEEGEEGEEEKMKKIVK